MWIKKIGSDVTEKSVSKASSQGYWVAILNPTGQWGKFNDRATTESTVVSKVGRPMWETKL